MRGRAGYLILLLSRRSGAAPQEAMSVKVSDIMTRGVISISSGESVQRAAELMLRYDMSGFPVLDHGKLVGVITEGDFMRRAEIGTDHRQQEQGGFSGNSAGAAHEHVHSHAETVGDVMTREVITIAENASLETAVRLMERHHIKRLIVVRGDAVTGLISRSDLLHAFLAASPKRERAPAPRTPIHRKP